MIQFVVFSPFNHKVKQDYIWTKQKIEDVSKSPSPRQPCLKYFIGYDMVIRDTSDDCHIVVMR